MKYILFIIYLFLAGYTGVLCSKVGITVKDKKYWCFLGCVIGAYFCGKYGF